MECLCFDKKICEFPQKDWLILTPIESLKIEQNLCSELIWEVRKHKNLHNTLGINNPKFTPKNLTQIKLTNGKCEKFKLTFVYKVLKRHFETLNLLEEQVFNTNQQKYMVFPGNKFKHLTLHTCTILDYISCLKEYIKTKMQPLFGIHQVSHSLGVYELDSEIKNYQKTIDILGIFCSFKNFYSEDFDKDD